MCLTYIFNEELSTLKTSKILIYNNMTESHVLDYSIPIA